jgi:hypothetical protein
MTLKEYRRYNLMLDFIKELANSESRIFTDLDEQARDLLEEMGESK